MVRTEGVTPGTTDEFSIEGLRSVVSPSSTTTKVKILTKYFNTYVMKTNIGVQCSVVVYTFPRGSTFNPELKVLPLSVVVTDGVGSYLYITDLLTRIRRVVGRFYPP